MASESTSADIEGSVLQVLECIVNYVDPTTSSNAMNAFVGGKRACAYCFIGNALLLASICKARGRTCRPQEEAQKRGLGSSIDIKDNRKLDSPNGNY